MAKAKRKANPLAGSRNLELAIAMQGKGGNLTHKDKRTKRARTRGASKARALREYA